MLNLISTEGLVQSGILAMSTVLLGVATLNDIAVRTIPDSAPLGLVVIGVVIRLAHGNLPHDHAVTAFAAAATVLLLGALCWRCGWLGGGDVKLLAACAWLVPPTLVPQLVLLTAIAGGVLACVYLLLGKVVRAARTPTRDAHPRSLAGRIWRAELWRIRRGTTLPYGCAIAAATLFTLFGR